MDLSMKKLIESPKEWLEFYKKLNELYNFHLEYYGPENDCIKGYTNPYFLPIKYPVIISGYSTCLLYTSPSPRDMRRSRMPSSA